MSRILIAYATSEGQTAKIARFLAGQLQALGHSVQPIALDAGDTSPDPSAYEAVIVAASVHAGRHQKSALHYVQRYRDVLAERVAAFLSASMAAAATKDTGLRQASEQAEAFLNEAGWRPEQVEMVGGAFRLSRLSWLYRWMTRIGQKLFKKELGRLGWPDDLTRDVELTDWDGLHRFAERFAARLQSD